MARGRGGEEIRCLRWHKPLYITGLGRGVRVVDEGGRRGHRESGWCSRARLQWQGAGDTRGARASGDKNGTRGTKGRWWVKKQSTR